MKKIFGLILTLILIVSSFSLLGCDGKDYGTLTITVPEEIYVNYPGKEIKAEFSNPKKAEEILYVVDQPSKSLRVAVKDGLIYATGKVGKDNEKDETLEKSVKMYAKTEHHEVEFTVTVKQYNGLNGSGTSLGLDTKASDFYAQADGIEAPTVFIGDSFFSDSFWKNFYSEIYIAQPKALKFGVNSATVRDWLVISERCVYPLNPKNIVIHLGTNDVYDDRCTVNRVVENLKALVDGFHSRIDGVKVYFFGIEPRLTEVGATTFTNNGKKVNQKMIEYAEQNEWFTYIDSPAWCFLDEERETANPDFFVDKIHPKAESYNFYANALTQAGLEF